MIRDFDDLFRQTKNKQRMRLVVAAANELEIIKAIHIAVKNKLISCILVGDERIINNILSNNKMISNEITIIDEKNPANATKTAIKLINDNKADFIMKGLVDTSTFLKNILHTKNNLITGRLLSHIMLYDIPNYHKILALTDGGMNLFPEFEEKCDIIKNAISVFKALEISPIYISCLSANEKINSKIPSSIDGDLLKKEGNKGTFGSDVIIEGPISLDLAISKKSAEIKKFDSPVIENTDILLVPNIETGNGIGKTLTYFTNAKSAGIVMGAKVPILLVSRSDSFVNKLNSIVLGSKVASYYKKEH
jgi:phosphate butyryltransferase